MTAQELRASLLREAVTGRLVPQRAEEGSAETLYGEIQQEKARLIAEKKIKKEKPLPPVTEEEQPFSIPATWKWVHLHEIVYNRGQMKPTKTFSYIDIGSIDNLHQKLSPTEKIMEPEHAPSRARKLVDLGDIIYSTVRPYLHNTCIIDRQFSHPPIASTGFAVMTCCSGIYNKFLFAYLLSPAFDSYANSNQNAKGVAYPAINDEKFYRAPIPLPPLAEQKRIVDKLEELLPLVDAYGEAEQRLAAYEARFPDTLKRSLLQEAITGRLVPQRAEEGSAETLYEEIRQEKARLIAEKKLKKEKPLPPVTEEEQLFPIPASWKWVRLGECISARAGLAYKKSNLDIQSDEMIRVLRGGNILNMHYALKDDDIRIASTFVSKELLLKRNMIITPAVTSLENLGKAARIEKDYSDIVVGGFVLTLTPHLNKDIFAKFILYTFCSKYFRDILKQCTNKSGQAFYNISRAKMLLIPVPLPPLEEQKRIVAKLEELLALAERIREARR